MGKTLEKIASKNAKKQIFETKGVNFVSNGEDVGRANYKDGKKAAIFNGRQASMLKAYGDGKGAQRYMLEGAKGAGAAKTALENREIFNKNPVSVQISLNESAFRDKKEGYGKGKGTFGHEAAKYRAEKLPKTTIRPVKKNSTMESVAERLKSSPAADASTAIKKIDMKKARKLSPGVKGTSKEVFERKTPSLGTKAGKAVKKAIKLFK